MTGVAGLSGQDERDASALIDGLANFGIFVVPNGGLESWLRNLGVTGKPQWLARVFQLMGEAQAEPGYVVPGQDDVWAFIDRVARWAGDPVRPGT
jgi:hypothetical protein